MASLSTTSPIKSYTTIPQLKLDALLCDHDCDPSVNHDGTCYGDCFQVCPPLCKTLMIPDEVFDPDPLPTFSSLFADHDPITEIANITQHNMIATTLIVILSVLVAALTVFLFCFLRFHYLIWRRRERLEQVLFGIQDDFPDEDQRPGIDHPIWYINTVGLQQSVIDSITVLKYKKDEFLIEGTDCSVCLCEFEEDDSLKLLPKCSHAFHIPCIDTWLTSHKNCPLCRAPIVSDDSDAEIGLVSVPNFADLSSWSEFQMQNSSSSNGVISQQVGGEGTSEARNEDDTNCLIPHEDESTDTKSKTKLNIPTLLNTHVGNGRTDFQSLRRSVSFDSSSAMKIHNAAPNVAATQSQCPTLRFKDLKSKNSSRRSRNGSISFGKLMKSASIGHLFQKGPISTAKPLSSSLSTSRHSRSHDSILPF